MKVQLLQFHLILLFSHAAADLPPSLEMPSYLSPISGRKIRRQIPSTFSNYALAYQTNTCDKYPADYVQHIQAQWNVPNITVPPSATGPGEWWMYQGVAVDGMGECPNEMALGGVVTSIQVDDAGVSTIQAYGFYQYLPGLINIFSTPAISIGDSVQMNIDTLGFPPLYTIVNLSTNQTQAIRVSTNETAICSKTASFFVADPGPLTDMSPFAAFPDFTMSSCSVSFYGADCDLDGSTDVQMVQNTKVLVTPSSQSSTDLLFHYDG